MEWDSSSSLANPQVWGFEGGGGIDVPFRRSGRSLTFTNSPSLLLQTIVVSGNTPLGDMREGAKQDPWRELPFQKSPVLSGNGVSSL